MSKRSKEVSVPVSGVGFANSPLASDRPVTHYDVSVWYEEGGMSYFTYKNVPRGFYVAIRPVSIVDGFKSFMLMDDRGGKRLIAGAKRFSEKTLDALSSKALRRAEDASKLAEGGDVAAALSLLVASAKEA